MAQDDLMDEAISRLGFASVLTGSQLEELIAGGRSVQLGLKAFLVFCARDDVRAAVSCCELFDEMPEAPPLLLLMATESEDPYSSDRLAEAKFIHRSIIDAGADDVISLVPDEPLTGHRINEALTRITVLTEKVAELVKQEVDMAKAKTPASLQAAWKRCMWNIPASLIEGARHVDEDIDERTLSDFGIGDYTAECQLSSSPTYVVVKACHPKHGQCVLKAFPRVSVATVAGLVSINKEICLLQNLARHPLLVHGIEAMQTASHNILAMEYAGDLNLQSHFLRNAPILPPNVVEAFCIQEAAVVQHLHRNTVCHMDLKPSSFVVSKDGRKLCLIGLGSASNYLNRNQRCRQPCGYLPFVAPEVLRMQPDEDGNLVVGDLTGDANDANPVDADPITSYNGFSADVWSLGMNFAELACGIYSTEKLLGWIPRHPDSHLERIAGIETLAEMWLNSPPDTAVAGLHVVIARMLVLNPEDRWTLDEVVEEGGLRLEDRAADPGVDGAWVPPA